MSPSQSPQQQPSATGAVPSDHPREQVLWRTTDRAFHLFHQWNTIQHLQSRVRYEQQELDRMLQRQEPFSERIIINGKHYKLIVNPRQDGTRELLIEFGENSLPR